MFFEGGFPGSNFGMPRGMDKPPDNSKFYDILGVPKTATTKEITKAFRKLATKIHPDRPGGDEEKFKEAQKACEVLSDPDKRELYDRYGEQGLERGGPTEGASIFDLLRGGPRPGRRSHQTSRPKPPDINQSITITLEDSYQGTSIPIQVKYKTAKGCSMCEMCGGQGFVLATMRAGHMVMQSQQKCKNCRGTKREMTGEKILTKTVPVDLPKGVQNGDVVVLDGQGHDLPQHQPGDVRVKVHMVKHAVFERVGADLAMEHHITLLEALLGSEIRIKHLSGTTLVVKPEPGEVVVPCSIKSIADWGMPQKGGHGHKGNLNIKFIVQFPTIKSLPPHREELRKLLEKADFPSCAQEEESLGPGVKVELQNIEQHPTLNGVKGTIVAEIDERWVVKLEKWGADSQGKTVSLPMSGSNLKFIAPASTKGIRTAEQQKEIDEGEYVEDIDGEDINENDQVKTTPAVVAGSGYDVEDDDMDKPGIECRSQ